MQVIWGLLLNRYVIGGAAILAVLTAAFWAGDRYGFNARAYAKCKTETARRNSAIETVNKDETEKHKAEEVLRAKAAKAFASCPNIQSCILTRETAACLDLLAD